jgi:hypothetical protein
MSDSTSYGRMANASVRPDQPLALFLDDLQWLEGAKLGTRASAIVGNSLNAQPRLDA